MDRNAIIAMLSIAGGLLVGCGGEVAQRATGTGTEGLTITQADDTRLAGSFVSSDGVELGFVAASDHGTVRASIAYEGKTIISMTIADSLPTFDTTAVDSTLSGAYDELASEFSKRYGGEAGSVPAYALLLSSGLVKASHPSKATETILQELAPNNPGTREHANVSVPLHCHWECRPAWVWYGCWYFADAVLVCTW